MPAREKAALGCPGRRQRLDGREEPGGGGTRHLERRGGRAVPAGEGAAWGWPAPAPARGGSCVGKASNGDGGEGRSILFDLF